MKKEEEKLTDHIVKRHLTVTSTALDGGSKRASLQSSKCQSNSPMDFKMPNSLSDFRQDSFEYKSNRGGKRTSKNQKNHDQSYSPSSILSSGQAQSNHSFGSGGGGQATP